jgi:hypothetical protein
MPDLPALADSNRHIAAKDETDRMTRIFTHLLITFGVSLVFALPLAAQSNPFSPRIIVNERVVSNYELEQRVQFLKLLPFGEVLQLLL